MLPLVPEVHLFICLDERVAPGVLLHTLDLARAQDWQQETVLLCSAAWRNFVNIDQPVIFIEKDIVGSVEKMDSLLDQLDNFDVKKVTQVGELRWGRWINAYFEGDKSIECQSVVWEEESFSSLQVINDLSECLGLDLSLPRLDSSKSASVYLDPYHQGEISIAFKKLISDLKVSLWPNWLNLVLKEKDRDEYINIGLESCLVDFEETETSLFNQSVICFSDQSDFAQTSRSYNVALYNVKADSSLFLSGDISISVDSEIHFSEFTNLITYWKAKRLKELSFQWFNMGIEIFHVESFHNRFVKRNLLNYSSDLFNCQTLLQKFVHCGGEMQGYESAAFAKDLRKTFCNDPYSLSFSLKLLNMIVDRMLASASAGERLFQRLGSDYHRVIIGEALVEGLIESHAKNLKDLQVTNQLSKFKKFLMKIDHQNDQLEFTAIEKG